MSPGVIPSRLRDSNPRPTHYETVSVRAAWCLVVPPSDVSPDQSTCGWLVCAPSYYVVQRRPATGWPPVGPPMTTTRGATRVVGLPQCLLRLTRYLRIAPTSVSPTSVPTVVGRRTSLGSGHRPAGSRPPTTQHHRRFLPAPGSGQGFVLQPHRHRAWKPAPLALGLVRPGHRWSNARTLVTVRDAAPVRWHCPECRATREGCQWTPTADVSVTFRPAMRWSARHVHLS